MNGKPRVKGRESRAQEVEQEELVEDFHAAQGGLNGLVDEVKGGEPSVTLPGPYPPIPLFNEPGDDVPGRNVVASMILRGYRRTRSELPTVSRRNKADLVGAALPQRAPSHGGEVWAFCQMPNHVHMILTPSDGEGLSFALSRAHRLYSGFVNARARRTGHLFQGRFGSVPMDEAHVLAAARYVALNPVRARLVDDARDWPHSSVAAHLAGRDDGLVKVRPLLDRVGNFADLIQAIPTPPISLCSAARN